MRIIIFSFFIAFLFFNNTLKAQDHAALATKEAALVQLATTLLTDSF